MWLGDKPFSEVYPSLFQIVRRKEDTVANVLRSVPLNVSFRCGLVNANRMAWLDLVPKVVQVLTDDKDVFRWNLTKKGLFIVRSYRISGWPRGGE